eukprot:jgi/Tetstr1/423114/TSEL_013884.t1
MVTRSLRNIMSVENVSAHVFIHKNLDLATEVADNMKSAYGMETYSGNFAAYTKIKTEAQFAASIIDRVNCPWRNTGASTAAGVAGEVADRAISVGRRVVQSNELLLGRRGSLRAALLDTFDEADGEELGEARSSPSSSPPREDRLSRWGSELGAPCSDAGEDDTGSRRITREDEEGGSLPTDMVCVVEQLGGFGGGTTAGKLSSPFALGSPCSSGARRTTAKERLVALQPTYEDPCLAAVDLSQSMGQMASSQRSAARSRSIRERLNASTPMRGSGTNLSPVGLSRRHSGHLAATVSSLSKTSRTARSSGSSGAVEPEGVAAHHRSASTGAGSRESAHRRNRISQGAAARQSMSMDMHNISEDQVLLDSALPASKDSHREEAPPAPSPPPPSALLAAYRHLEQRLDGPHASELSPQMPDETLEAARLDMLRKREVALQQALLAIEEVWATERAVAHMAELSTSVVAAANSGTPQGLMSAVDGYLGINKRVMSWPKELGADEGGAEDVLSQVASGPSVRRGALMESTAAPAAAAGDNRKSHAPATSASPSKHRRGVTMDNGTLLDPALLSVQAANRLAAAKAGMNGLDGVPVDTNAIADGEPRGSAGQDAAAAFLAATENWFAAGVAHKLCGAAGTAELGGAGVVAMLNTLKRVQDWAEGLLVGDGAGPPPEPALAASIASLQARLRDAVIQAGSQLVRSGRQP